MSAAFAQPVTGWIVGATLGVLASAALIIFGLSRSGRIGPALTRELWQRTGVWAVLLPLMLGAVLAGRVALILFAAIVGLLCLREFDRATGLFRERLLVALIVCGILAVNFAALDAWYGLFVALWPLTVSLLAVASLPLDRPAGYIQRTGLGVLAFMLFGSGLAHLGFMANDPGYRPIVLLLLLTVAFNDVAAFTCGKLIGGPKLLPATSPNKTLSGALGALLVTTALVALVGKAIFAGTPMDHWGKLIALGLLVSLAGQCGDLMLSSIKRDLGIKDMGAVLPGHGGVLDRANSLLLVAPAAFHFLYYFGGITLPAATRVVTG